MSAKFSMGVASFIVQYRITKLLKSTLFVKLPAIRFHILTSFLVGKLVVLPADLALFDYANYSHILLKILSDFKDEKNVWAVLLLSIV